MALVTGNAPAAATTLAPYWERLEPIDGGYQLTNDGGQPRGQIRVFDDREAASLIRVQVSEGRYKGARNATLKFESLANFDDLIDALTRSRDAMYAARRK